MRAEVITLTPSSSSLPRTLSPFLFIFSLSNSPPPLSLSLGLHREIKEKDKRRKRPSQQEAVCKSKMRTECDLGYPPGPLYS